MQARDEQQAARRREGGRVDRTATRGVEAALEGGVQLGGVGVETEPGRRAARVLDRDRDEARGEEPLHDRHRLDEPLALGVAERREERLGERVALAVEDGALRAAGVGQAHRPHAAVGRVRLDDDEAVGLERAQQPAEVARVEVSRARSARTSTGALPTSHRTRDAPSGRPRARYSSCSTPMRCVTVRLNDRTCSIVAPDIL